MHLISLLAASAGVSSVFVHPAPNTGPSQPGGCTHVSASGAGSALHQFIVLSFSHSVLYREVVCSHTGSQFLLVGVHILKFDPDIVANAYPVKIKHKSFD